MQRFKNILVIYNNRVGDDSTLDRATELAKRNGARLTVAEVLEEPERLVGGLGSDSATLARLLDQRRSNLERLASSVRQEGIPTRSRVLTGNPFLGITREVVLERHDLVMMTAEGSSGLHRMLLGSTSLHLMRKCPCPVWVTQGERGSYSGILAAIDVQEGSDDRLNRTILELASSLARREQSELHVVHAWELEGNDAVTSRSEITPEMLDALVRRNEAPLRRRVESLLEGCDVSGLPIEVHLPRGRPEWVIPELAREKNIELIVMGTVSRSGVRGLFIGNTAETVLQQVDCAVLTVKPPGFVTPVLDDAEVPVRVPAAPTGTDGQGSVPRYDGAAGGAP